MNSQTDRKFNTGAVHRPIKSDLADNPLYHLTSYINGPIDERKISKNENEIR